MSKLFEAVDKASSFINEVWVAYDVPVTSIRLYYGKDGMTSLDVSIVKAFNVLEVSGKTTRTGYLVIPADDNSFNGQFLNEYLENDNITQIIVNLKGGTTNSYTVSWNSQFESIDETNSIMLFECRKC